jgi:hypothetical protein
MLTLPLQVNKLYLTNANKVVRMSYICHSTDKFIYTEYPNEMYEVSNGKGAVRSQDIIAEIQEELFNEFINTVKSL